LAEVVNKWIDEIEEEAELALYSFSMLTNGRSVKGALEFSHGTSFYVSSYDNDIDYLIADAIERSPMLFNGMEVKEIKVVEDKPKFSEMEVFQISSPIFIKRMVRNNDKHITYKSDAAGRYLTETLKQKMAEVGMRDDSLEVSFVKDYHGAKERLINYRGVPHKASWCPVMIKGKLETKAFAWAVGLGDFTGIGFGALK
jgi:CRISPR-associated endoribonuclease Cas6